MKKELEKIIKQGYKEDFSYGDCVVYFKDKDRIMYRKEDDKIILKYNFYTEKIDESNGELK